MNKLYVVLTLLQILHCEAKKCKPTLKASLIRIFVGNLLNEIFLNSLWI